MDLTFHSRMTVEQVLAVNKKRMHYKDKKHYLLGEVNAEGFTFTVGSFQKGEELPRFVFSGTVSEENGKAKFTGSLKKTQISKSADKITAFSLAAIIGALLGILMQISLGKWYYSVAGVVVGAGLGVLSHFTSTKREIKAFAGFFKEYMKKVFRAEEAPKK